MEGVRWRGPGGMDDDREDGLNSSMRIFRKVDIFIFG